MSKKVTLRSCATKSKRESHLTGGINRECRKKFSLNLKRVWDPSPKETWIKGLTIKLKLSKLKIVAKPVLPYTLPNKMKISCHLITNVAEKEQLKKRLSSITSLTKMELHRN